MLELEISIIADWIWLRVCVYRIFNSIVMLPLDVQQSRKSLMNGIKAVVLASCWCSRRAFKKAARNIIIH